MPTKLPRVLVTLKPDLHAAVSRAATAAGTSKSAFISSLLEPSIPVLHRMAEVLEAAAAAPQEAREGMLQALEGAVTHLVPVLHAAGREGQAQLEAVASIGSAAKRAARLEPAPVGRRRSSRTPA